MAADGNQTRLKAVAITLAVGIVGAAELELARRPADQIRGPKWAWRIACTNVVGVIAYRRWGRI
jgi:hypothetical protein